MWRVGVVFWMKLWRRGNAKLIPASKELKFAGLSRQPAGSRETKRERFVASALSIRDPRSKPSIRGCAAVFASEISFRHCPALPLHAVMATTGSDLLNLALKAHGQGDLDTADRLCRKILARES